MKILSLWTTGDSKSRVFFFNQLVTRFRMLDTRGLDALFEV